MKKMIICSNILVFQWIQKDYINVSIKFLIILFISNDFASV